MKYWVMKKNKNVKALLGVLVISLLVIQVGLPFIKLPHSTIIKPPTFELPTLPIELPDKPPEKDYGLEGDYYEPSWDIIRYLGDNPNEYELIWEPWVTKAAVHAITATPDYDMFAFGGGYLYDNEIHIFRWNSLTRNYEKVWCSGDQIIGGDVLSLAIGDTDYNNFLEIVAGSADGHIYVFEQRHIYDPLTNIENQFELVWKSPFLGPVWKVAIGDLDKDFIKEIIAVTWDKKIHIFEYDEHSGYPFSHEHWITYKEVWNSGTVIDDLILSMGFGDINYNGLPDILVGTRKGKLYLFENNGTVIYVDDKPFPLTKDNDYKLIWSSEYFWNPIFNIRVGNTDNTPGDEAVIVIPGYGTLVMDYDKNSDRFFFIELVRPIESWEKGTGNKYEFPLDYYIDRMVDGQNVYYIEDGEEYEEPITYTYDPDTMSWNPDLEIAIMNTAMAGEPDDHYSKMNSSATEASWAILDFGKDEEILGDGQSQYDFVIIVLRITGFNFPVNLSNFQISVSMDGEIFIPINSSDITQSWTSLTSYIKVNIDNVTGPNHWRYVRYIKINVTGGDQYAIDAIRALRINKPVSTALSVELDNLEFDLEKILAGEDATDPMKSIILGTMDGRIYVFRFNETSLSYDMIYDSYMKDNATLCENIWDIYRIGKTSNFPVFYAEPFKGAELNLPSGYVYYAHTFFYLGGVYPHLIVGTKNSTVLAFTNNGFNTYTYDPTSTSSIFSKVNTHYSSIGNDLSLTVKFVDLLSDNSYYEILVGYFNESAKGNINPLDDEYVNPNIGLDLWYYIENGYNAYIDLTDKDKSGRMKAIVLSSEAPPTADFYDVDNDGDLDLVLCNGRLYYFENQGTSKDPAFVLIEGYFDGINNRLRGRILENPIIVDFDNDGDFDIIVSFYNRNGATYFENEGTLSNPRWVEKRAMFSNSIRESKPITNFGYNNFTDVTFTTIEGSLEDVLGTDFVMTAYNSFAGNITMFYLDFNHQSRYLVATYPLVYILDLALMDSDTYKNYGYHLLDTWDNYRDLIGWTLTLEHSDVDGDGIGEVIIGDFDNNIYIFEHLVNNTYKRAFRSPDIKHNETTDVSPYAWEELEGISGNFTRIVWDHVTEIVVNVNLDGDQYQEFIAVADFSIYIFEATNIDDTYELVWYYSLRDSDWFPIIESYGVDGITAVAYTRDIDQDSYRDFAIAAGNLLFIFRYIGNWEFMEFYAGDPPDGRFNLPGNPQYYPELFINTIAVGDLDDDNYYELVLGGVNTTESCLGEHGFVIILEFASGNIQWVWTGPMNYYRHNPVYQIRIDNQDYDNFDELIVGHSKGIDIWEYNDTKGFVIMETITSNPNHPEMQLKSVLDLYNAPVINRRSLDMIQLQNGTILAIYGQAIGTTQRLYWIRSNNNGTSWTTPTQFVPDTAYSGLTVESELYPSIIQLSNGDIWVTWHAKLQYGTYEYSVLMACRWNGTAWEYFNIVYTYPEYVFETPSLFEIDPSGNVPVGIVYHVVNTTSNDGSVQIIGFYENYYGWFYLGSIPNLGSGKEYGLNGLDMAKVSSDTYVLVFSGYWRNESKADYDIWAIQLNSTFHASRPVRVTHSFYHESHPDIAVLPTTPNATILVVYESSSGPFGHSIHASYSRDLGFTWSREYELPSLHPDIRVECGRTYVKYLIYARNGWQEVADIMSFEPTVAQFIYGGFIYGFNSRVTYYYPPPTIGGTLYGICMGINPSLAWTLYDIGPAYTFDTGDSDRDNRKEIVTNYYDSQVTVFELQNSNVTSMYHAQVWYSPRSPTKITDISVGDSNGNGWPEIVFSAECGNVYSYEMLYQTLGQGTLSAYRTYWERNIIHGHKIIQIATGYFLDDDHKSIIVLTEDGLLFPVGPDGSYEWDNPVNVTELSHSSMIPTIMVIGDVYSRSLEEIIVGFRDGYVLCLTSEGDAIWVERYSSTGVYDLKIGYLGSYPYIAVVYSNRIAIVDPRNGNLINGISVTGYIVDTSIGEFNGDKNEDLLVVTEAGDHIVYNVVDGSEIWHVLSSPPYPRRTGVCDLNGDGIDDVVTHNKSDIVALDGASGTRLWNVTIGIAGSPHIFILDIDGEEPLDVVAVYRYDIIGLDGKDGKLKWHTHIMYPIEYVDAGYFKTHTYSKPGIVTIVHENDKRYILAYDNFGLLIFGIARFYPVDTFVVIDDLELTGLTDIIYGYEDGYLSRAVLSEPLYRISSFITMNANSGSETFIKSYYSENLDTGLIGITNNVNIEKFKQAYLIAITSESAKFLKKSRFFTIFLLK